MIVSQIYLRLDILIGQLIPTLLHLVGDLGMIHTQIFRLEDGKKGVRRGIAHRQIEEKLRKGMNKTVVTGKGDDMDLMEVEHMKGQTESTHLEEMKEASFFAIFQAVITFTLLMLRNFVTLVFDSDFRMTKLSLSS